MREKTDLFLLVFQLKFGCLSGYFFLDLNKTPFLRNPFYFLLLIAIFFGCSKSNQQPPGLKPTLRQPIGMRVTYPLMGYPGDTVRRFYRFNYDSNANSFNIQMIDSTLFDGFNPQLINEAYKSYVFTLEQPKRLSAIQYSKYGAGGGYSDYNVNFDYISYGFDPSYIEMLILPGSNMLAYGDVSTVSVNWIGNRLDVLNCSHKYQVFHPKREDFWGPLDVRRYTDTSFEFIFNGVSMYSALFDDPVHFPDYTYI